MDIKTKYVLIIVVFSTVFGMFFGFLSWVVKNYDKIESKDKMYIRIMATAYTLISALVANAVALYLYIEWEKNVIICIIAGSIAALFTKVLMQRAEHDITEGEFKLWKR